MDSPTSPRSSARAEATDAGPTAMESVTAIGGDSNRAAVGVGEVKGECAVVPQPGVNAGSIAGPSRAADIGATGSSSHRTLRWTS
ncbi:hypothetical protein [Streptomyces sp. WMMC940]|uniref:hypothetical protein n=1 Tax=Streptomyces sp. WMMC940 TaxID=3015153 RepID=UPI003FCC75B2